MCFSFVKSMQTDFDIAVPAVGHLSEIQNEATEACQFSLLDQNESTKFAFWK